MLSESSALAPVENEGLPIHFADASGGSAQYVAIAALSCLYGGMDGLPAGARGVWSKACLEKPAITECCVGGIK